MSVLTPAAAPEDDSLDGVERELLEGEGARLGSDEAGVDRAAARLVVQRFRAGERRRRVLVTAGSALALAAAAALAVGLSRQGGAARPLAQAAQSSLVVESGSVTLPGAASVGRGAPVAADALAELSPGTCLRAGSRVRLCTSSGAKLKLPALGGAWDVALEAGAITADLEAMPAGFTIRTLHGVAAVEGTLFSVELDASRAFTSVLVERGRVHVTNLRLGEQAMLLAGEGARLGERLELASRGHEPGATGSANLSPQGPSLQS